MMFKKYYTCEIISPKQESKIVGNGFIGVGFWRSAEFAFDDLSTSLEKNSK